MGYIPAVPLRRALVAFLAVPGVVAFLVPLLLARAGDGDRPFNLIGLLPLLAGSGLLLWCVREFHVAGKGTLAPWAPPRHLVTSGPYRVTRNPMYAAVVLILTGWAIGFSSLALVVYAVAVLAAFLLRVTFGEERWLARTHRDEWTRYAARVPRWVFRTRRGVWIACAVVLISLPIAGLVYEAYADGVAAQEFPPPGMLVDVGGRRLHLFCIGNGEPTVFFEASGWGNALSFAAARQRVAARSTVCSYDRSGMGWSDPARGPVSAGDLARDLAVLQDRANLHGPYILVASSIGGLTAELYARQLPERVAGLVLVDAANSLTLPLRQSFGRWVEPAACVSGVLAHFGLIRLADPFGLGEEGSEEGRRNAALTYNSRPWMQLCAMARGLPETVREFAAAPPLRADLPLTVLSASTSEELLPPGVSRFVDVEKLKAAVLDSHQRLARQSANGRWQLVPDSTHLIAGSQPDAVAEAVLEMVEQRATGW